MSEEIELGRDFLAQKAWRPAFATLSNADKAEPLALDDLERLALAAYMTGEDLECAKAWTRAHHEAIRNEDQPRAARCAFWQACGLLFKGEMAPAMGWIARGRRVLDDCDEDCVERAWLLAMAPMPDLFAGKAEEVLPAFSEAEKIAERFDDPDVTTYIRLVRGHALVLLGQAGDGLALLDEVMVAVTSGEVYPVLAGIAYCQVIAACQDIFDLRRAREWTVALARWCESQPDLVPYRGNCLIHRCEILQLQGAWPEAKDAAEEACDLLSGPTTKEIIGSAYYQRAEIQRLRGALAEAEESYRRASQAGRNPEPGLSLLRLAQGRGGLAVPSIRRVIEETENPVSRAKALPAYVEIMLAADDTESARDGADKLTEIAAEIDAPFVHAIAGQAEGAVLIAEGQGQRSLPVLKNAWRRWQELEAPYEAARVRVLIALAYRQVGDEDSAALELDAARWSFGELGAELELRHVEELSRSEPPVAASGLTPRETEVLVLLAGGKTNREIASSLLISEHTVARHVQNIFGKLDVSSRTAASAFAFEHDLV